jgi:MFS family permease
MVGSVIAAIGVIIQAPSTVLRQLLAGRLITGIGVGVLTSTVGLWQAETSPAHSRGRYMALELFLGAFGLFLSQWINYGLRNNFGRTSFAFPICFQLVFIVVTGTMVCFLPESPRWLVKSNRYDEALEVIIRLEGKDATAETPEVADHFKSIMEADSIEGRSTNFFSDLFSGLFVNGPTQNARRILLAVLTMCFHQFNGINR